MKRYELIVVGGGFSGLAAAVCAARRGVKTLIIEASNCFGGAAVNSLVLPFMPYSTKIGDEIVELTQGLFAEIKSELKKINCFEFLGEGRTFNEEHLKLILNRMVIDSGAEILFRAQVVDAKVEDGVVNSVLVSTKAGNVEFEADYFVDATGDAMLSTFCGVKSQLGRKEDSLCQPMTLCFRLINVDIPSYKKIKKEVNALYDQYRKEGKIKNTREDILTFPTLVDGVLHFNSTRIVKLNPTDPFDVTRAEIEAREQAYELFNFLKSNFEPFKNSEMIMTAAQIGIRESRMIEGEYTITAEDLKNCTVFEDKIATGNYDIDIHNPEGSGTSHYYFPAGQYYTIPYRSLVPKNMKNLLVCGRCISATHEAQASIRIMPICCSLGEAAGLAIRVAKEEGSDVKNISIEKLQNKIIENGGYLG